ncbi:unnamed protein product, partial [Rotaria sp. Silwood1]
MASSIPSYVSDSPTSVIQENDDYRVNRLAAELINSDVVIRQSSQLQELIADHESVQSALQAMGPSTPFLERINSNSTTHLDNIIDSADSLRSIGRICRSLQNESLSQEAVEVVNTEGRNVVTNLFSICSRTVREVQQNTHALEAAIAENERTRADPITNELLQQQLEITKNISVDPRQAYRQMQEAVSIGDQLRNQIERVEPNENASVRPVANRNSQYLKYAARVFFVGAAAVAMCAGIAYLSPIVTSALRVASAAVVSGEVSGDTVPAKVFST